MRRGSRAGFGGAVAPVLANAAGRTRDVTAGFWGRDAGDHSYDFRGAGCRQRRRGNRSRTIFTYSLIHPWTHSSFWVWGREENGPPESKEWKGRRGVTRVGGEGCKEGDGLGEQRVQWEISGGGRCLGQHLEAALIVGSG